jgi:hypothetical protein
MLKVTTRAADTLRMKIWGEYFTGGRRKLNRENTIIIVVVE